MLKKTIFLLTLLLFCRPSFAAGIKHDLIVHIGPFDASRTSFEYNHSPKNYLAKSEVLTFGVFDFLYPFKAEYLTSGKVLNNRNLQTEIYKYKSKTRTTRRSKEMIYNEKGLPIYRISSKNDKNKKVDIQQDPKNEGTTDLQTVFAQMAMQYNQLRFCDSRQEVFDGKRRFDVIFKDEGNEIITANEFSPFSGQAHKCSMYIDKLGSDGDDMLWQITSDRPIYFWILEDEKSKLPFIAKVDIESTPLGRLQVFTHKITVKE